MAWNGVGTYVLPPAFSPEVNGTTIDATRYNGLTTDVATGITQALNKNGENSPSANINFGAWKITNLGAGSVAGDALAYNQPPPAFNSNVNSAASITLTNINAGINAFAGISCVNSSGASFSFGATGVNYTGLAEAGGDAAMVFSSGAGGVAVCASAGSIRWAAGAATEQMKLSGGNLGIGTIGNTIDGKLNLRQDSGDGPRLVLTNRVVNGAVHKYGSLLFSAYRDIADPCWAAGIWSEGASAAGNTGDLVFGTAVNNTASNYPTEVLRITSGGNLIGRGVSVTASKAAATSRSSSAAFADDPDLIISLNPGRWAIQAWLDMPASGGTANAAGMQVRCAFTGTQTSSPGVFFSNENTLASVNNGVTDLTTGTTSSTKTTGNFTYVTINGSINVTVAGNFSIQWSQLVSQVSSLTVAAGSYLICTKLG